VGEVSGFASQSIGSSPCRDLARLSLPFSPGPISAPDGFTGEFLDLNSSLEHEVELLGPLRSQA